MHWRNKNCIEYLVKQRIIQASAYLGCPSFPCSPLMPHFYSLTACQYHLHGTRTHEYDKLISDKRIKWQKDHHGAKNIFYIKRSMLISTSFTCDLNQRSVPVACCHNIMCTSRAPKDFFQWWFASNGYSACPKPWWHNLPICSWFDYPFHSLGHPALQMTNG